MPRLSLLLTLVVLGGGLHLPAAFAQRTMVTTTTPFQSNGDSFTEGIGLGWQLRGPGFFAQFGGAPTLPPFAGATPNAGLQTGFNVRGGPFSGSLNLSAFQGYSRSSSTIAPTLTTTSGYPGSLFVGSVRPFVTGIVPVGGAGVGNGIAFGSPAPLSPLDIRRGRLNTPEANRLTPGERFQAQSGSVAAPAASPFTPDALPPTRAEREAAAREQQSAANEKALAMYHKGLNAQANGKPKVAQIYFRTAARSATGALKSTIEAALNDAP